LPMNSLSFRRCLEICVRLKVYGVSLLLCVAVLGGCDWPNGLRTGRAEMVAAPIGTISIYQLAGRLNMTVEHSGSAVAIIRNKVNTVLIYPEPDSQVIVNGKTVNGYGRVATVSGILFVPEQLSPRIKAVLRKPARRVAKRANRRKPSKRRLGLVVIDPGHGGRDPGAISVLRTREKDVNLAVARKVSSYLAKRGVKVIMTRSDDRFIELNERAAIANRAQANLFVSIHADSCHNRSARGSTIYIANSASSATRRAGRLFNRRLSRVTVYDKGIRTAGFRVLVRTSCPAVLVELGYLSNRSDAKMLADPAYQKRLAEALADSVVEFLSKS